MPPNLLPQNLVQHMILFHTINNTRTSPPQIPLRRRPLLHLPALHEADVRPRVQAAPRPRQLQLHPVGPAQGGGRTGGQNLRLRPPRDELFPGLELNVRCRTLQAVHSLSGSHERKVEMRLPGRLRHGLLRRAGGGGSPGRRGTLPQSSDPPIKEV